MNKATIIILISIIAPLTQAATNCATVTEIPSTECEALVALYNSTNGDNWENNSGWLENNTPCSWDRVTCNGGHVSILNLMSNKLTGTIPPEIGNLSNLIYLFLYSNKLTGTIPPEIGNLSNLIYLFLYSNKLTGTIPPEIGNLSNLIYLDLMSNQLTGTIPPEIGNLSNLIYLFLFQNKLTGTIPPEIGNLSNLTTLSLDSNQLIPPNVGTTDSELIEWLNSHNPGWQTTQTTQTTNCATVTKIPSTECEALVALYNSTNGDNWKNNSGWLENNTPCSWDRVMCNGGHASELDLRNNKLTGTIPPEIGKLSNLIHLYLSGNELTGTIPPKLKNLTQIKLPNDCRRDSCLKVDNNHLTATDSELIEWLNSHNPGWQTTQTTNCATVTKIPSTECEALVALYNSTNGDNWKNNSGWLENNTPCSWDRVMCNGGHVSKLELGNNELTGTIPPEIGKLSRLTTLSLYGNKLTGTIPPEIGKLSRLTTLYLSENELTGTIPPKLTNLTSLKVDNNHLSATDSELIEWLNSHNPGWQTTQTTNCATVTEIPSTECEALVALYNSTNGDNWKNNSGWLENNTPCNWDRVTCNGGHVSKLDLVSNGLTGTIPPEIGKLSKLTALYLEFNQLSPPNVGTTELIEWLNSHNPGWQTTQTPQSTNTP